jgi:tetratricopeptide (TPR) repeat protein
MSAMPEPTGDASVSLFARWQAHVSSRQPRDAGWYEQLAQEAIDQGIAHLGIEITEEGRELHPSSNRLHYLAALALLRGSSLELAAQRVGALLKTLPETDPLCIETWALAGSIAKRRYAWAAAADQAALARASADAYEKAMGLGPTYFPVINAATMRMLAGEIDRARDWAQLAIKLCDEPASQSEAYWRLATLGEAHLLLGEVSFAEAHLRGAATTAGRNYGQIATTRNQLRLLKRCIDVPKSVMDTLRVPAVLAFSGHMPDRADAPAPRFPPDREPDVIRAIARHLESVDAGFGYASAAAGADLLFAEALIARGAEVHLVLPFATDDFVKTSVINAGEAWLPRFRSVLARATSITHATAEPYLGDALLFDFTNRVVQGMAILRAQQLCVEPRLLTVAHTGDERPQGGTASAMASWRALGHGWTNLDPMFLRGRGARP